MTSGERREFLKRGLAAAAALGFGVWPGVSAAEVDEPDGPGADLVLVNGRVFTIDSRMTRAEAFAVKHGRFIAVGSSAKIRELSGPRTQVIDAAGMTVTPGFIDAHTHPAEAGIDELLEVNCDLRTIAEIQDAIRTRAEKTPEGQWVLGFKYDDTKLRDGRGVTRQDLDQAAPRHPVRMVHRGGHTAIFNSRAFEVAKVTKDTPDPEGGRFGRDENGELTGFAAEHAREMIENTIRREPVTPWQRQAGVKLISELMTAAGLTSIHDAMASKENFVAYRDALAAGEMRFRAYVMAQPPLYEAFKAAGIRTGFGNERLRVGGIKLFCDGSASERTMRMSQPYVGRPMDYGILVTSQDRLNDAVLDAHSNGYQVGVHANGDVAIDMVLTAYELALRLHPRPDPRHRIEHCTLVNPDLLERIAKIGAIPTPFYTYVHYHGDKWAQYGPERLQWMFAHRSFLDHQIRVAPASDHVPGPFEPLMAIQSMVTRKDYAGRVWGPNQRITVDEALRICTINGAYASFEEKIKGSITAGKLADFVILANDPHDVVPDEIKNIKVVRTVVGGRTVFEAA